MYDSLIPLLVIRTDAPALLLLNAAPVGEAGNGHFACAPLSDTGDFYISALPLTPGGCALVRKLGFLDGTLVSAPEDADICVWPGGVYELILQLPRCPIKKAAAPYNVASIVYNGAEYTLYYEDGLRLLGQQNGASVCAYSLGEYTGGELIPACGGLCVIARGESERLLLLNGSMDTVLDISGQRVGLDGDTPYATNTLGTLMGHERKCVYRLINGEYTPETQTGFFNREYRAPVDRGALAAAFMEAVHEGCEAEARSYITQSLQEELTVSDIKEFLGPFDAVRLPLFDTSGRYAGLITKQAGRICSARLYEFEYEGMLISNISEL